MLQNHQENSASSEITENVEGLLVRSQGYGTPTLLFVHGYCCSGDDWKGQMAALSGRFHCVALDLPGHGGSAGVGDPTLASLGDAVNRVKRSLVGPVIMIGHSMGCKTIREAYRQCEAQVAGLVFIDGSLYVGRRANVKQAALTTIDGRGTGAFLADLVEGMFSDVTDHASAELVRSRARQMDLAFARSLFLDSVSWDMEQAVQTIREIGVPTMVVQCTSFEANFGWRPLNEDERTPFMTLFETLVPLSQIAVLRGSGHFPMFDAPADLSALLDRFVRSLADQ